MQVFFYLFKICPFPTFFALTNGTLFLIIYLRAQVQTYEKLPPGREMLTAFADASLGLRRCVFGCLVFLEGQDEEERSIFHDGGKDALELFGLVGMRRVFCV